MRRAIAFLCLVASLVAARAAELAPTALTVGSAKAPTRVEFYLSPTCPMCAATFRNTVLPLLARAQESPDALSVRVALMPRNPADIPFARFMSCVPAGQMLPLMTDWFGFRRTGEADLAKLQAFAAKRGLLADSEAGCTSERNDRSLLAANHHVFTVHKLKDTPAVFVNGKPLKETYYLWQLEDQFPAILEARK